MSSAPAWDPTCGSQHCITCGDDGDPMTVVRVDGDAGLAQCGAEDGVQTMVQTALVDPVAPGERLLVHAGTAIARLQHCGAEVAA